MVSLLQVKLADMQLGVEIDKKRNNYSLNTFKAYAVSINNTDRAPEVKCCGRVSSSRMLLSAVYQNQIIFIAP